MRPQHAPPDRGAVGQLPGQQPGKHRHLLGGDRPGHAERIRSRPEPLPDRPAGFAVVVHRPRRTRVRRRRVNGGRVDAGAVRTLVDEVAHRRPRRPERGEPQHDRHRHPRARRGAFMFGRLAGRCPHERPHQGPHDRRHAAASAVFGPGHAGAGAAMAGTVAARRTTNVTTRDTPRPHHDRRRAPPRRPRADSPRDAAGAAWCAKFNARRTAHREAAGMQPSRRVLFTCPASSAGEPQP